MANFPTSIDDDSSLPAVNDNITEIGGEAINALRDAVFNIETEIGIGASGSAGSISSRLSKSLLSDGSINPSALTSLGLVTLPITNDQIAAAAGIQESKLSLDYKTQDLYNYILDLSKDVNSALGWIAAPGSKLEPHISGSMYKHYLSHILVSPAALYLENKLREFRDNSNAYELINDLNNELLVHQWADGSPYGIIYNIVTNDGGTYPSNYAHTSSGIYLNTSRFNTIPQTAEDLQQFAEFVDSSSIFLLGSRMQNLFSNGISRESRSSSFLADGYGQALTPTVPAITYLLNTGGATSPFDDIDKGDDIVELLPPSSMTSNNSFDAMFALVKIGDIIRVNYGGIEVPFIIKEKKYIQSGLTKKFVVRINGKNLTYTANASARIDKSLVNYNKYGALSICAVNNSFSETPSLIVSSPRAAQALGVGFDPDLLNSTHYMLYLALFTTGKLEDGYTILPGIDVTGNKGETPGKYTLDSIVEATNAGLRQVGYNYRFTAFSYNGEFGIMLSDSYNNASFSILSAVYASDGTIDESATLSAFPNNAIGTFTISGVDPVDPLGFGTSGANIASPPYMGSYGSAAAALVPTKLFVPLRRNNYYISGTERDKLSSDIGQAIDDNGDTFWEGTVKTVNTIPGSFPSGHVEVTYTIPLDLSASKLKAGKTITIQSLSSGGTLVDFGRFIIKTVEFTGCTPSVATDITVYDAVHGKGISPYSVLDVGSKVALYFDSGSVSFNKENSSDISLSLAAAFKRNFEVFVTDLGDTFTHERARVYTGGASIIVNGAVTLYSNSELSKLNIIKISPKLRGYDFGSVVKITLRMTSYSDSNGTFSGYLCKYDGSVYTKAGPVVNGRKGEITRFYDETNVDYIDILFDANTSVSDFSDEKIDFQLYPSLSLDNEVMLIGTCQFNDVTKQINYLSDCRQFGNTSEKDLSTSALNMISLPEKLLHENGVITGFDMALDAVTSTNELSLLGGTVLVDGKILNVNNHILNIPALKEYYGTSYYDINWLICVNSKGDYQLISLLDYDKLLLTPNDIDRVTKVYNPNNGQYYYVDSSSFSNIVNNRKDLTPLYMVSAETTYLSLPATVTYEVIDVRKYINDLDSNLPLKFTIGKSQGNFKEVESIFTWLRFNHKFNSQANLNGVNDTITKNVIFDYDHMVTVVGENNATVNFEGSVSIGSNITFKDLSLSFKQSVEVLQSAQNIIFDNCVITIDLAQMPTSNIVLFFYLTKNVQIKNCTINYTSDFSYSGGTLFKTRAASGFVFDNNKVSVTYNTAEAMPGQVFILLLSDGVKITNSNIEGNFLQCVVNEDSNNFVFTNNTVTTNYSVRTDDVYDADSDNGMPFEVSYDTTNLANSGRGIIYANISTTLDNIIIEKNIFNYDPELQNTNRISFINFDLSSYLSWLSNVKIRDCTFNHLNYAATADDIRSAITILNRAEAVVQPSRQPTISNIDISNNRCNRNQMFLLTSVKSGDKMVYPGLFTQNCVIRDNIAGSIGYWTIGEVKFTSMTPTINNLGDKFSGLIIDGNNCHAIINLDEKGKYYLPTKFYSSISLDYTANVCDYPSGNVTISNNKANWIHVANTYEQETSINVINNSLCAYDLNYLEYYDYNSSTTHLSPLSYGYAIFVGSNVHATASSSSTNSSPDSSCIISNNTINKGDWSTNGYTNVEYSYLNGYIFSQGSANIKDNICKGIDENINVVPVGVGILLSGVNNIVTGNKIYRNGKSIFSYVAFGSFDTPTWNGSGSSGIIKNNYFDSPWVTDTAHTDIAEEMVVSVTLLGATSASRWLIDSNINQTGWKYIPLTTSEMTLYNDKFITPDSSDYYINHAPGTNSIAFNKSMILHIHEADTVTPSTKKFGWQENLNSQLPDNVKIINISMGMRTFNTQFDNGISYAYLALNKYNTTEYTDLDVFTGPYNYSPAPPVLSGYKDPYITNDSSPPAGLIGGFTMSGFTNTIPIEIDTVSGTDVSELYSTNRAYGLTTSFTLVYKRVSGNDLDIYLSPLFIKYRW